MKDWALRFYKPIGTTDSEHAFCWILDQIRRRHPTPPKRDKAVSRLVRELCAKLNARGTFNMMLCDSRYLYCHCSTDLSWLTRRAPFGEAHLVDTELTVNFAKETTPRDIVTVIATRPFVALRIWQMTLRLLTVWVRTSSAILDSQPGNGSWKVRHPRPS